jgi:hypothetical protein
MIWSSNKEKIEQICQLDGVNIVESDFDKIEFTFNDSRIVLMVITN